MEKEAEVEDPGMADAGSYIWWRMGREAGTLYTATQGSNITLGQTQHLENSNIKYSQPTCFITLLSLIGLPIYRLLFFSKIMFKNAFSSQISIFFLKVFKYQFNLINYRLKEIF